MKTLLLLACCCLPLRHLRLNSPYGYRIHPITGICKLHSGADLYARHDTVFAITSGQCVAGYDAFLGVYLRISDGPFRYTYGHLSGLLVSGGEVRAGVAVAITGATGRVTGEHLHLSISYEGQSIDPIKFLYQITLQSKHHE